MRKLTLTAVCVLFLIKLRWPKNKSLYDKLVVVVLSFQILLVKRLLKLRITSLKYLSWYLCQISLQIMQLPIQINHLFFISRSSSFPVIDVSVDIKSKSKKKQTQLCCCLFRVAKTTIMDVYQQAGFTQSKKYPFHIGSPVVRTSVRLHDYKKFLGSREERLLSS